MSGMVDFSGAHADPVHLIDVLLGLNPENGQAKVMSGRCGASELLIRATCGVACWKTPLVVFMCEMT